MLFVKSEREQPCLDCGNAFPWYVMEFDHARGKKLFEIAKAAQTIGLQRLMLELEKCDVVCANCHRTMTYKRKMESGGYLVS